MAIEQKILTFGGSKIGTVGGSGIMGFTKPFDATDIPSCVQWLDNDINQFTIGVGNRISQWRDKSGLNHHVNQATGSRQPVFISGGINGQNGVYFNNNEDNFLDCIFSSSYSQPYTIITIWNVDNLSTRTDPRAYDVVSGNRIMFFWFSNNIRVFSTVGVNIYAKNRPFNLMNSMVEWNGANTTVYENGVNKGSGNPGAPTLNNIRLGHGFFSSTPDVNSRLSGYICEHIIYSRLLLNDEKTKINNYLTLKYGL